MAFLRPVSIAALSLVLSLASSASAQEIAPRSKAGVTRNWAPPTLLPVTAKAHRSPDRVLDKGFQASGPDGGCLSVVIDRERLSEVAAKAGPFVIRDFPLDATQTVDLEVERFWVTEPDTTIVVGRSGRDDQTFNLDLDSIILLRGQVAGMPHSHVYIATAPSMTNGVIEFGAGRPSYGVSGRSREGNQLAVDRLTVFLALGQGGHNPLPFCEVGHEEPEPPGPGDAEPRRGLRQHQLAIETDYEFFQLFGNLNDTGTYVVQLYGAVSDIYMREINVRIDLPYVRLWDQPIEPFGPTLDEFRSYWNANMMSVARDSAQMYSGRGDLPGGVAYLSSICNNNAYGFCGNAVGYFADPQSSSVLNYDPLVTAHELGHNCGTGHTHDYALDNCGDVSAIPQRGTIMSYCNQTVSGAMAVEDLSFHKFTRGKMLEYIPTRSCIVFDCNQNGRADSIDISLGFSPDANTNGIPDECEDCNHNQVLDSIDITTGFSRDLNTNGIPDECEPDCNNNNVPDDRDIALGTSQDAHGDGVPDECDADRNNNNQSDYNELFTNMTLDKDRNRVLDITQDCDNNGTPDLTALQGAHDGWVASTATEGRIREYHSITGVLMNTSGASTVTQAQDLIITADRRILVTSADTNRVVEFDRTGALVGTLVPAGSGGLANPAAMLISPTGTLLVASRGNNAVLEFNLTTGAFIRALAASGSGGLTAPFGLTRKGSDLYVSSVSNQVFQYNISTGAFVRVFVTAAGNGGLSSPRGLLFKPDGNLLVASFATDQVKEYNGTTGAYIRDWLVTGLAVDGPWCLRLGRDGMVYISRNNAFPGDTHVTRARVFIFDTRNGNFLRAYVQAVDAGLEFPTGFDFMPGDLTDCNRNQIPDSCDIALGTSTDVNNNGIPDECERTCYANCDLSVVPPILNINDFVCYVNQYAQGRSYANCDGSTLAPVLNVNDFQCFVNKYAAGCP